MPFLTDKKMIYLDQAATSFPKNKESIEAQYSFLKNISGNPSRTFSYKPAEAVFTARESLAKFLKVRNSSSIIFTPGATYGANIAIFGILSNGDHAVVSSMEHNAVMRPLFHLAKKGVIRLDIAKSKNGVIRPEDFRGKITNKTKLIVCLHGSNVTGKIFNPEDIANIKKKALFLCDASQTIGHVEVFPEKMGIDLLFFSGHKGLKAPFGTGALYKNENIDINPLIYGGTGMHSETEDMPDVYPDKLEAGTLNVSGIAALGTAANAISTQKTNFQKLIEQRVKFIEKLSAIRGITIYSDVKSYYDLPIISLNIDKISCSDIAFLLKEKFGILSRAGLHCAPYAHKSIGAYPCGTLRLSFNSDNTTEELDYAAYALNEIEKNERLHTI